MPRLAEKKIRQYVKIAHDKGIAVRVTKPIEFPVWIRCVAISLSPYFERIADESRNAFRNMYWQMLLDCGVDWLDVDDLYSAGQF